MAILILCVLGGCSRLGEHEKYQLVSAADGKVYRLNRTTGEVTLIPPEGLRVAGAAGAQSSEGVLAKGDIDKEFVRRAQVYMFLSGSSLAKQIQTKLVEGRTNTEEARGALSTLLPKELGSLPLGAEKENWAASAKAQRRLALGLNP